MLLVRLDQLLLRLVDKQLSKRRLTYPQRHPLNWKELAFQKALKGALPRNLAPASVCVTGPSNHSTYMPIFITLFLKQRTLHPGAGKQWSTNETLFNFYLLYMLFD